MYSSVKMPVPVQVCLIGGGTAELVGGEFQQGFLTAAVARAANDDLHFKTRKGLQAAYEKLENRVRGEASTSSDATIDLSGGDLDVITDWMTLRAVEQQSPGLLRSFSDDFSQLRYTDSFLYGGLGGRTFSTPFGKFSGGQINYIGVGAAFGVLGYNKLEAVISVGVWNGCQGAGSGCGVNIPAGTASGIGGASFWTIYGHNSIGSIEYLEASRRAGDY
jgi:hypothetical protein